MALFQGNIFARTLGFETQIYVSLPNDGRRYNKDGPVKTLILLHGISDNASGWIRYGQADALAQKYNVAVVIPEGMKSLWLDMKYGGKYTTYLTGELPELAGKMFRIPVDPDSLMIAGLSMGGFGALHAAFTDPDAYCAVGSFSGAINAANLVENAADMGEKSDVGKNFVNEIVAAVGQERKIAAEEDIPYLARLLSEKERRPDIYLACGTEDILTIEQNNELYRYLQSLSLDVKYETWKGVHDWEFWNVALDRFLEHELGVPKPDNVFDGIPEYVKK